MNNYSVYKLTCPQGKVYIGVTSREPRKRWASGYGHNPYLSNAITKYGWSNIRKEVVATGLTKEVAEDTEARLVDEYQSTNREYGYNINRGGSGLGIASVETRRKIAARMVGDLNPTRRFGHPFKGKRHSEESKQKMSNAAKARTGRVINPETKKKLRHAQKNIPVRCVETGAVFDGIHIAAEATGLTATKICAVCQGRRKTTGGYRWEYVEEG